MLKSMTGFGRGEYEDEQFSVTIEMKTVNHRYNEVAIRLQIGRASCRERV